MSGNTASGARQAGVLTAVGYARLWVVGLVVVAAVFVLCMMVGPGDFGVRGISFGWPSAEVMDIRPLRILCAAVVGLALAAAGVTLQALLRNPLADPYVLGISTGSSVGVMLWLLLAGPLWGNAVVRSSPALQALLVQGQMVPAAIGAVLTCGLVFALAARRRGSGGGLDPLTLLLVGVVISAMNGAILMVLNSLAPAGVKSDLMSYVMGSISSDVTWKMFYLATGVVVAGYLPMIFSGRALNVGSLSEVEAVSLGVNVGRLRTLCLLCASVMTGAAIVLSGPIGFVGLICPHICRRIVGSDHRKLVVAAPLCGAAFLMLADTAVSATGALGYGELPVGVVTALCGGPFFLWLLKRGGGEMG